MNAVCAFQYHFGGTGCHPDDPLDDVAMHFLATFPDDGSRHRREARETIETALQEFREERSTHRHLARAISESLHRIAIYEHLGETEGFARPWSYAIKSARS